MQQEVNLKLNDVRSELNFTKGNEILHEHEQFKHEN